VEAKVEEKAEAKAEVKDDNDVDLFGSSDEDAAPAAPIKPIETKPAKKKPVAKSIVVFDVKVYEEGFDLDGLWEKIKKEVVLDGLVFNNEPKKINVIGKIEKLQIGCVIEDDKVFTDDIFDKILSWEDDVQSVDIVNFQKL
jgi:elongation factor 1-beta